MKLKFQNMLAVECQGILSGILFQEMNFLSCFGCGIL